MIRTVTRNDWDLGPVEDTQVVCSACESLCQVFLGHLGRRVHFRCGDCGAEYSHAYGGSSARTRTSRWTRSFGTTRTPSLKSAATTETEEEGEKT